MHLENCAYIFDQTYGSLKVLFLLVRNLNPSLLPILKMCLGSGLMNVSIIFLKTLQEIELRILITNLFTPL